MDLYHLVPEDMRGTTIYPLRQLAKIDPDLALTHGKKYENRAPTMEARIPTLGNCRWNDVVFFTAAPPAAFRTAWEKTGVKMPPRQFFKVDSKTLDPAATTVWLCQTGRTPKTDFESLDEDRAHLYSGIPPTTIAYYRCMVSHGQRPFLFYRIPHILSKKPVDINPDDIVTA